MVCELGTKIIAGENACRLERLSDRRTDLSSFLRCHPSCRRRRSSSLVCLVCWLALCGLSLSCRLVLGLVVGLGAATLPGGRTSDCCLVRVCEGCQMRFHLIPFLLLHLVNIRKPPRELAVRLKSKLPAALPANSNLEHHRLQLGARDFAGKVTTEVGRVDASRLTEAREDVIPAPSELLDMLLLLRVVTVEQLAPDNPAALEEDGVLLQFTQEIVFFVHARRHQFDKSL
mmetsp:Transcript_18569/g.60975  ORF Transcript_18569/g.60975 Transcript_18569/m.60975 type:complete len:230 (+) Transcript_18569:2163-2852(+)